MDFSAKMGDPSQKLHQLNLKRAIQIRVQVETMFRKSASCRLQRRGVFANSKTGMTSTLMRVNLMRHDRPHQKTANCLPSSAKFQVFDILLLCCQLKICKVIQYHLQEAKIEMRLSTLSDSIAKNNKFCSTFSLFCSNQTANCLTFPACF